MMFLSTSSRYLTAISSILHGVCCQKYKREKHEIVQEMIIQEADNVITESEEIDIMHSMKDALTNDTCDMADKYIPEIYYSDNEEEKNEDEVQDEEHRFFEAAQTAEVQRRAIMYMGMVEAFQE